MNTPSDIRDERSAAEEAELLEFGPDKRGHKSKERRCVALGEIRDPRDMVRFAKSPDNIVVPDIAGKLPGRGVWVSADKVLMHKAIKSGAFARGFKSKVCLPEDLSEQVEAGLRRSVLALISMAKKSGQIAVGFDQTIGMAREGALGLRLEAANGSSDGRSKIRTLSRAVARELELGDPPIIGCFTKTELGETMGRDKLVHAGIKRGKLCKKLRDEAGRLSGYVPLIPTDWVDYAHEVKPKEE
jgi:predicted RNA-binding protein YlxR (DUF448 family)